MTNKTIQRIASGNTRALDKLYKELKPAFVAFFREHFNMDADSVQDLYQETMAAVYNNIITGRLKEDSLGRTKLSTYATQVGKHIHMSHLRKRQPNLTFETDKVMALGDSLPDEEDASKEEKLFIVRRTVEDMPYPCSKILNLFYFLQKSGKEIAKIMDYSNLDVVKTQIYKCKLFDQMADEDPLNRCGLLLSDCPILGSDIAQMDLSGVDTVILSACNTGLGDVTSEGVAGLQKAFRQAGVMNIAMSLETMNDDASCENMLSTYGNILNPSNSQVTFGEIIL